MAGPFLLGAVARVASPSAADVLSLLCLSAPELHERIRAELEENPLLVAVEEALQDEEPARSAGTSTDSEADLPVMEWMADPHRPSLRPLAHTPQERHEEFLRSLPDRPEPLHERLYHQFLAAEEDAWRRWIGEQVIFNLDERGFVRGDFGRLVASIHEALAARAREMLSEARGKSRRDSLLSVPAGQEPDARLAKAMLSEMDGHGALSVPLVRLLEGLQVSEREAESVLRTVQGLEPTGVGARDLRECLLLQLAERDAPPLARRLVETCLEDLEAGRLGRAAKRAGAPIARVRAAARIVQSLDRAPGLSVTASEAHEAVSDALIERADGGWCARLSREAVPRLAVSRGYSRRSRTTRDPDTKTYLARHFADAACLVAALRERDRILQAILDEVVRRQGSRLDHGPSAFVRLFAASVARALGLPAKTVSRAIEGKSVATTYGVLPLRAFFGGGRRRRG